MEQQLRQLSSHYPRRDELTAHVTPILDHYSSLRPEQGVYYHDDGRAERLLSLTGVIPVSLRGTTYHCPLVLYLPLDYPAKPPIVQVLPTATMQVKASAHVDAKTNRVVVPYMVDWARKGEGCSLTPLLEALTTIFSKEYPLVSISKPPPAPPSSSASSALSQNNTGARPPPRPPLPPPEPVPSPRERTPVGNPRSDAGGYESPRHGAGPPRPPPPPPPQSGSPVGYAHAPAPPSYQPQGVMQPPRPGSIGGPPPRPPPPPGHPIPPSPLPPQRPTSLQGLPQGISIPAPARPASIEPHGLQGPPPRPPPPPHAQTQPVYGTPPSGAMPFREGGSPVAVGFAPPPPFGHPSPQGHQFRPAANGSGYSYSPNGSPYSPYAQQPALPHQPYHDPRAPPTRIESPLRQSSHPQRTAHDSAPSRQSSYAGGSTIAGESAYTHSSHSGSLVYDDEIPSQSPHSPPRMNGQHDPEPARRTSRAYSPAPSNMPESIATSHHLGSSGERHATQYGHAPSRSQDSTGERNRYEPPAVQDRYQPPTTFAFPPAPVSGAYAAPSKPHRPNVNILDGPEDILSSAADSPASLAPSLVPPRPPNPELLAIRSRVHSKLAHALAQLGQRTDAEMDHQGVLEIDLLKGEPAILDEMQRLEVVRTVCENVRDRYRDLVGEGEARLAEYEMRGEGPEVDEIVCSSTVVYNQLLELVAEDAALEDTIYHLGRGLNSETANLDLDRFLKRVRGLARQQFLARALTNKILLSLASRRDRA